MGGLLGATVAAVALLLVIAASGHAEAGNPNQYDCNGYIKAGEPEPLTEGAPIAYFFVCNGPITGYQIQSQIPLEGFEPAPLVENDKNEPVKETFSCGGETPGYAFNCVGSANAPGDQITGQFNVPGKLCAEPREDPLLTVTYAYLEAGVVTQAISGPFDLGRPHGCPADAQSGSTRLSPKATSGSSTAGGKGKKGKHHGKKGGKSKHPKTGAKGKKGAKHTGTGK